MTASQTGLGYWEFTGKKVGSYELVLEDEGATHVIPLTVEAGAPNPNSSDLEPNDHCRGRCRADECVCHRRLWKHVEHSKGQHQRFMHGGPASFVTNGTWEIDVQNGGTDRSCTIRWSGLLAQTFYDVDEVLLGGAVGSTNTAMTMAALLLFLLLAVLVTPLAKGC